MKRLILVSILLMVGSVMRIAAFPVAALDLPALTKNSELIVVGTIESLKEVGQVTVDIGGQQVVARRMSARLRVARVIKGNVSSVLVDMEFFQDQWGLYEPIGINEFGMFFLKHSTMSAYGPIDRTYPVLVALSKAPTSRTEIFDKVISELANVIISGGNREQRSRAIEALKDVRSNEATEALKKVTIGNDPAQRLAALAILVRQNDRPSVVAAVEILLHSTSGDRANVNKLSAAIRGVNDPKVVNELSRLLGSSDAGIRRSAAYALRQTHSFDAISGLTKGLNDSDREVRYQAVMGLTEFTQDYQWGPSIDTYSKDEQIYLNHWKDWAKNR